MRPIHTRFTGLALIAFALAAPPALAGTITVKPGESIQAAIDSALPNDVIRLKKGSYREVLLIETTGLRLEGGGAILDARPDGVGGSGAGITVTADNVSINKLTVRHALSGINPVGGSGQGDGVSVSANGFRASGLTVQAAEFTALRIVGDDAEVERLTVEAASGGLAFTGTGLEATRCRFFGIPNGTEDGICFLIDVASDVLLERNSGHLVDDGVIVRNSSEVQVLRNKFTRLADTGIEVVDSSAVDVERNVLMHLDAEGIAIVASSDVRVISNRIVDAEDGVESNQANIGPVTISKNVIQVISDKGIDVDGPNLTVEGNRISHVADGDGIQLVGDLIVCRDNRVSEVAGDGIGVTATTAMVVGNRVHATAHFPSEEAMVVIVDSADSVISKNTITNSNGPAMVIGAPNGASVSDNLVKNAVLNGLVVDASSANVVVDGNRVTNAFGEGIQNLGVGTAITNNVVSKTRSPLTDAGGGLGIVTLTGNKFGKGFNEADVPTPEIDV